LALENTNQMSADL